MAYLITGLVEYQEHGKFSPRLGDRMIFIQAAMAAKGYSTGGRAPYGFARALVDAETVSSSGSRMERQFGARGTT